MQNFPHPDSNSRKCTLVVTPAVWEIELIAAPWKSQTPEGGQFATYRSLPVKPEVRKLV